MPSTTGARAESDGPSERVLSVDWSGRRHGERRAIWLAEVRDGAVTRVEDGRSRDEIADHLSTLADDDPALVVGMDFSFSLPAWFLAERGYSSGARAVGRRRAARRGVDHLRRAAVLGAAGCPRPELPEHFRATEASIAASMASVGGIRPKSTFQVSGAGSVGAGSLRGFPVLAQLRAHGFSVWPFDDAAPPAVFEIWPRLLTGPVVKTSLRSRGQRYLDERYPALPESPRADAGGRE